MRDDAVKKVDRREASRSKPADKLIIRTGRARDVVGHAAVDERSGQGSPRWNVDRVRHGENPTDRSVESPANRGGVSPDVAESERQRTRVVDTTHGLNRTEGRTDVTDDLMVISHGRVNEGESCGVGVEDAGAVPCDQQL